MTNMQSIKHFFTEAKDLLTAFDSFCRANDLLERATADHICYKCDSAKMFEDTRALFEHESAFVYQSIISDRRIAVIKFLTPLDTIIGQITTLELSDQKLDGSQTNGFDHVEIYPKEGSVESLIEYLESCGVVGKKVVRPHHTTYDISLEEKWKIRLEPEALVDKIKREEMK